MPLSMKIKELYLEIRKASVDMCAPLEIEDYVPQASEEVSPPKWNIAHTTWFFEEMILKEFVDDYVEFHSMFSYLFNSYYEHVGQRASRNQRGIITRPTVKEVIAYRKYIDDAMLDLLEVDPEPNLEQLILLGLNHEQQHQELFHTDLKYTFSLNPLFPAYSDKTPFCEQNQETTSFFLKIEEGIYEIGHKGESFCFDNELPRHKVFLNQYEICNTLVTNGDYLEFMENNGYGKHQYWHSEGWAFINEHKYTHPLYWRFINDAWYQYTLSGLRKIDPSHALVHINYYEAAAFAEWKGMRLPTEFEWEIASSQIDWGERWEWTESAYSPYPGFEKSSGAVGEYNGKFMVNQKVLRGASVVTPKGHSRQTYRNFFHAKYAWQYTGIRLAKK